jgi:hypothetical protein
MNYIEARPGLSVRKEDCIIIEAIDDMSCKISTPAGAIESIYPSWRILMLLEQPNIEEQIAMQPQTPGKVNLWGAQHFAG